MLKKLDKKGMWKIGKIIHNTENFGMSKTEKTSKCPNISRRC